MNYTTVSVRSRQIKARTAAPGGTRKLFPPEPRQSAAPHLSAQAALSPLATRQPPSARRGAATPGFWEVNKAAILILFAFVVLMAASLYFLSRNSARPAGRTAPIDAAQSVAPNPSPLKLRPMGIASPHRNPLANGHAGQAARTVEPPDIQAGRTGKTRQEMEPGQRAAASPADSDEIYAALSHGGKLALPEDVAGDCAVGAQAMRNLSHCLAQNGARAQ